MHSCGGAGSRNPTSNDIQYQPVTIVQLEPFVLHDVTKSRVVWYRAVAACMAAVVAEGGTAHNVGMAGDLQKLPSVGNSNSAIGVRYERERFAVGHSVAS